MDDAQRVLDTYGTLVYRVCRVRLAGFDPSLADDAYQNTFLCWMEHRPDAEPGSEHERAWFVRCAVHRCTDLIRQANRHIADEIPESAAAADENTGEVMDALMKLPENYRMPLYLCGVWGYSTEEAARMLDLTPATLRVRLTRARRALAKSLGLTDYLPGGKDEKTEKEEQA
ncbi:MAG: RNA polymerase sigma factor [Clostridia bacterium]|nr:RNA polymerase sigma factor [Clostridia bacterium]